MAGLGGVGLGGGGGGEVHGEQRHLRASVRACAHLRARVRACTCVRVRVCVSEQVFGCVRAFA